MALAPSLPLLSVPSSSIILVSIAFCSTGFMPCEKKALVHQEYALKASTCSLGPPAFIVAWERKTASSYWLVLYQRGLHACMQLSVGHAPQAQDQCAC